MPTTLSPTTLSLTAWRHHDGEVVAADPSLRLETTEATGPMPAAARRLAEAGVRRVRLTDPVEASSQAAVPPLVLVRELTRFGIAVDWELVLDPVRHDWRELSSLYPPRTLRGTPDGAAGLAQWRTSFFVCKFIVRKGPGFLQIRDWRWSGLRAPTLTTPAQIALILALLEDTVDAEPVADVSRVLEDARLVHRIGDLLWTPAYRVWRWPIQAENV